MVEAATAAGVEKLKKELVAAGGKELMSSLAVRVKWGQNELVGIGNIRTFLKNHSNLFKLDKTTVYLVGYAPEIKPAEKPPEDPIAEVCAPAPLIESVIAPSPLVEAANASSAANASAALLEPVTAAPTPAPAEAVAPIPDLLEKAPEIPPSKPPAAASPFATALTKAAAAATLASTATAKGAPKTLPVGPIATRVREPLPVPLDKRNASAAAEEGAPETKAARKAEPKLVLPPVKVAPPPPPPPPAVVGDACTSKGAPPPPPTSKSQATPPAEEGGACSSKAAAPPASTPAAVDEPANQLSSPPSNSKDVPLAPTLSKSSGPPPVDLGTSKAPPAAPTLSKSSGPPPVDLGPAQGTSKAPPVATPAVGILVLPPAVAPTLAKVAPWARGARTPAPPHTPPPAATQTAPLPPPPPAPTEATPLETIVPKGTSKAGMMKSQGTTPPQVYSDAAAPQVGSKRKAWQEDTLGDEELKASILGCKERGIELELVFLAQRLVPTEEYRKACANIVSLLRQCGSMEWQGQNGLPAPLLETCGARAQNTDIDGSDMNIAFRIPPGLPAESREVYVRQLRDRLQVPPQSSFLIASDGMQILPHATVPVTVELMDVQPRTVAHIQIAELAGPQGPDGGFFVDDLIRQLCDTFDRSRDLVRLVKLWAVNHGLTHHDEKHMNGMAWTLLTIYFLQRQQYVASFDALQYGAVPSAAQPNLCGLLRGFFEFLSSIDSAAPKLLSVMRGQESRAPHGVPIFIEDPAEYQKSRQQRNLTEHVGDAQWARVIEEARKAADRLNSDRLNAEGKLRWFHWAEVFDPSGIPAMKAAKLPPLGQMAEEAVARASSLAFNPGPNGKGGPGFITQNGNPGKGW